MHYIIDTLNKNGYEAYFVGGCVRDKLLNRNINDYDICTSAAPQEIINIFKNHKINMVGAKYGTIIVDNYEITTFRIDNKYINNRKPKDVTFTNNLIEDLKRRDFTINAMCWNGKLIDPLNGKKDLDNYIIRCVGDPNLRFKEDALRILRAIRFSCQLSFNIEEKTFKALIDNINLLDNISYERKRNELNKILLSERVDMFFDKYDWILYKILIPEFYDCLNFNQNNTYHIYDVYKHIIYTTMEAKLFNNDLTLILAALLHDIGKPKCYTEENGIGHFYGHAKVSVEIAEDILKRYKYDNNTIKNVLELILYHDITFEPIKKFVKKWLNKIGKEQFKKLILLRIADIKAQNPSFIPERLDKVYKTNDILNQVLNEEQCFTLKNLAINGYDLINLGYKGKEIGKILNNLLNKVINDEIPNNKEKLLGEIK